MQTNRVTATDHHHASHFTAPAATTDPRAALIRQDRIDIDLDHAEPGFSRFLWSDRTTRTAALVGGITMAAVGGSVGITYAVIQSTGATVGVAGAGLVLMGCVASYIHNKADAIAYSTV